MNLAVLSPWQMNKWSKATLFKKNLPKWWIMPTIPTKIPITTITLAATFPKRMKSMWLNRCIRRRKWSKLEKRKSFWEKHKKRRKLVNPNPSKKNESIAIKKFQKQFLSKIIKEEANLPSFKSEWIKIVDKNVLVPSAGNMRMTPISIRMELWRR